MVLLKSGIAYWYAKSALLQANTQVYHELLFIQITLT
jgi:hypothetical protein